MELTTNTEKTTNTKFNIVEYSTGNVFTRHNFKNINETVPANGIELYRTHYLFSEEIIEYFKSTKNEKGKNTLKGFDGELLIDEIVIDIDDEGNLERAHEKVKQLLLSLESNHELDLNSIKVNFSGSKGFHIRLPEFLFGGFEPSVFLHNTAKRIVEELVGGMFNIDTSVYDKTQLMRVVNTINSKSDLYAIPLSTTEVFKLTIDEIKSLAVSPREFVYELDEYETCPSFESLKLKCLDETETTNTTKVSEGIFDPKEPGERHDTLAILVGKLIAAKWNDNDIRTIVYYWNQQNNPPKKDDDIIKEANDLLKSYSNIKGSFWLVRRGKRGFVVEINLTSFISFLNKEGFGKVEFGKSYEFIKISEMIASIESTQRIKDYVFKHLEDTVDNKLIKNKLTEVMYDKVRKYFNRELLETVSKVEMDMKADTIKSSYLFFKNGILEVNRESGLSMKDYTTLDKPIWDTQIKDREFNPVEIKYKRAEFEQYLWNAASNDENRMLTVCSAIGYLLHRYKNKSNAKAIILMDEKISENPVGRTGKSLLGKAISYLRESSRIDGKNFKFRDQFTFQQINLTTEIVDFNDVKNDFDFERLFSVLTDNMTIEYKNQRPFEISFEQSPKIMVSTNFTIKGSGDSYRDRMFEIEFSDHYNADWKPIDEFGHLFFDEWDEAEWNRFDNFMVECLQLYLDEGLVGYQKVNVQEKKLLMETSSEFSEFMNASFAVSREYDKEDLFFEFKKYLGFESDMFGKCPVKKNSFTKYLKTYATYKNLSFSERNSNGKQYVYIG